MLLCAGNDKPRVFWAVQQPVQTSSLQKMTSQCFSTADCVLCCGSCHKSALYETMLQCMLII